MHFIVAEPGLPPYRCTMPVESVPFLIRNAFLVVPCESNSSAEYARYRELVKGFTRDSAPSAGTLRELGV